MVRHSTVHVCIVMGAGHLTSDLYSMYVYIYLTLHTTIHVVQYTFPEPSPQREKEGLVTFKQFARLHDILCTVCGRIHNTCVHMSVEYANNMYMYM